MTDKELMQQALETLEWHLEKGAWGADIEGVTAALRERLAQEPVATPSRSFEDVYKVQTERLATERERADKAEQNYRLMIKNHVPRNIFDWNTRKSWK